MSKRTLPTAEALLLAIRKHCLDCCCGSRTLVEKCMSEDCNLYSYRIVDAIAEPKEEVLEGQISMFDIGGDASA